MESGILIEAIKEGGAVAIAMLLMAGVFFKIFQIMFKEIVESRKEMSEHFQKMHKENIESRNENTRATKKMEKSIETLAGVCRDINRGRV